MPDKSPRLLHVVSIPRSGSTVLTALLDGYQGFFCLPESGFPQVLDAISDREFRNREWTAALYQASCFGGSVLTLEETLPCVTADRRSTLVNIGLASAEKLNRPAASISWIVWKTTRLVSWWKSLDFSGDRFLVLHRDLRNVFESQFRVHFGLYNRNPWRFALFAHSYRAAFDLYPKVSTIFANYANLDSELPSILSRLGTDPSLRSSGKSALEAVRSNYDFHANIMSAFDNKDAEKLKGIEPRSLHSLERALTIAKNIPDPLALALRRWADYRSLRKVVHDAKRLIESAGSN